MKKKKSLLIGLSFFIITLICAVASEFNWKYMYAEIRYGMRNSLNREILFSKETGFYEEEFYLSIYAPTNEIYYTLDGSDPTKESLKYEAPILIKDASLNENNYSMRDDLSSGFLAFENKYVVPEQLIDKCTVLKAVYYDENGNQSAVEEKIYFVDFENKKGYENVNIISITSDPQNLFGDEQGIYVLGNTYQKFVEAGIEEDNWLFWYANYRNGGRAWERPARITVFDQNKKSVLSQEVGIRIQGGASRALYPKSLNIYARDEYGDNRLRYDFWGTGYYPKRMTLSCGGNDDRGKLLDKVGSELTQDCSFTTMNYEPYILFLNGEYWGFYYLTEKYDEHYIEQYYGVDHENIVAVKKTSIEIGTEEDLALYEQLCAFIEGNDMTIPENYLQACEMLDMENFIEYFAAEIYLARQVDWPNSNYILWRARETGPGAYEDGKWRWMLFDLNTASMQKNSIEHDTIASALQRSGLFRSLWKNAEFREQFSQTIIEMSETIFRADLASQKIDECVELMYEPMQVHYERFFGKAFTEEYPTAEGIRTFFAERAAYIPKMLEGNMPE